MAQSNKKSVLGDIALDDIRITGCMDIDEEHMSMDVPMAMDIPVRSSSII